MFARMPSASLRHGGRVGLVLVLAGAALLPSCTKSEDTEPFVPATEGPTQPAGNGSYISGESACSRLFEVAKAAYARLDCEDGSLAGCPGFLGPAGANGCYEYDEKSVSACEAVYEGAESCRALPCVVTARRNDALRGCVLAEPAAGGQGGEASSGGASTGDANGGASSGGAGSAGDANGGASTAGGGS